MTSMRLAELFIEAGCPPGVTWTNMIHDMQPCTRLVRGYTHIHGKLPTPVWEWTPGVMNIVHGARDAVEFICKNETIKVYMGAVAVTCGAYL